MSGKRFAVLAFGTLLHPCLEVAEKLDLTVVDMRFVKPLDEAMLQQIADTHDGLITIEEGAILGGAGSACVEYLHSINLTLPTLHLGLPDDFSDHGDSAKLLAGYGLDSSGIEQSIVKKFFN